MSKLWPALLILSVYAMFMSGCASVAHQETIQEVEDTQATSEVIAEIASDTVDGAPAPDVAEELRKSGLSDLAQERTAIRKRGSQNFEMAMAAPDVGFLIPPKKQNDIRLHILPIGAGACQVVECPGANSIPMVVDCGSSQMTPGWDYDVNQVKGYVQRILGGRRAIVVLSHADKDHYRYLPSILEPSQVQSLWMGDLYANYPQDVLDWAKEIHALSTPSKPRVVQEFPVNWHNDGTAVAGLRCGIADTFVLGVNNGTSKNDHSLMISIDYGLFRVIFPGDATKHSQDAAIQNFPGDGLQSTVLVASHHGAATEGSNNADWLAATQPLNVIYSAGTSYQHPRCKSVNIYRNGGTLQDTNVHPLRCGDESGGWNNTTQTSLGEYNTHNSGLIIVTSGKNLDGLEIVCHPGPC